MREFKKSWLIRSVRRNLSLFALVVLANFGNPNFANADHLIFDFGYRFESGETLMGTFRGEIDSNNPNVVSALFDLDSTYSGDPTPVHTNLAADIVTFSGGAPLQFATVSPSANFSGFSLEAVGVGTGNATVEAPGGNVLERETFRRAAWSLSTRSVPEPGCLAMLGVFTTAILIRRRKRFS